MHESSWGCRADPCSCLTVHTCPLSREAKIRLVLLQVFIKHVYGLSKLINRADHSQFR